MIKKYNNFLFENFKNNVHLLLEANLSATGDFMNKLNKISKEKGVVGKIATQISDFIDDSWIDDDDIKQNFFDVTEKDDMVSFLMQSKLPKDWDEEEDPSLPYTMRGRTDVKVSKIIKYIISLMNNMGDWNGDLPKDKDIESFVNLFKSISSSNNLKFKLVKGDDIAKYYNEKRYLSSAGTLGGSCMADESKGTFKIYSNNESKVNLLILIDEEKDKITGRALVWKLSKSPCEATHLMDRVYTSRDSDFYKFREYAEQNGYMYKAKMNSHIDDNVDFKYKGGDVRGIVRVKLDGKAKNYPFVDTMCFLNKEETELSNVPSQKSFMLHSVSGDCEVCDDCDGKMFICENDQCIFNNGEIDCDDCNGSGDSDSGKCVTCKGKGEVKCQHPDVDICTTCGEGLMKLGVKNPTDLKLLDK